MHFGIAHAPEFKNNKWHVIGRCVNNVHLGKQFTKIVPRAQIGGKITHMSSIAATLTVEKIIAYGHELQTLDSGLTALLILSGDGSLITDYCTLQGPESK